uniref:Uncharacterized protein n=1 Tax=Cacopsylla melanoneura TaxID=428564 RepID=A0A8D8YQH8_9HEMI
MDTGRDRTLCRVSAMSRLVTRMSFCLVTKPSRLVIKTSRPETKTSCFVTKMSRLVVVSRDETYNFSSRYNPLSLESSHRVLVYTGCPILRDHLDFSPNLMGITKNKIFSSEIPYHFVDVVTPCMCT